MDENSTVKLILAVGLVSMAVIIYSTVSISQSVSQVLVPLVIPFACSSENSTYFLATPTDSLFCMNIPKQQDGLNMQGLKQICTNNPDESQRQTCLGLVDIFAKRVSDCTQYTYTNGTPVTSVTNEDVSALCAPLGY